MLQAHSQLVLSLFHGIDLFGRGFDRYGFTVCRAGEITLGFDVRDLHLPSEKFDGIIAGTPCQDFSNARRIAPTGKGIEMLGEFARLVKEARPSWFCLENVPQVPTIHIDGYSTQRIDLNANECGLNQNRLRHIQFGTIAPGQITLRRSPVIHDCEPCAMASEGRRQTKRTFPEFCRLQGLSGSFTLPSYTRRAKYEAVGNGVALPMAERIAEAIAELSLDHSHFRPDNSHIEKPNLCACSCGRRLTGKQKTATARCRKWLELDRKGKIRHLYF